MGKKANKQTGIPVEFIQEIIGGSLETRVNVISRTIYLIGNITLEALGQFMISFTVLDVTDGPIKVVISSDGGITNCGFGIYDIIRNARNHVTTIGWGMVHSMAVCILQAGDDRQISEHTRIMVHNGSIGFSGDVSHTALNSVAKDAAWDSDKYLEILVDRTGTNRKQWEKYCDKETYFSAEEALEVGLVDKIITKESQE